MSQKSSTADLVAIVVCTMAWGTTWYAITLQLGVVPPVASIVWRFMLASALMFAICLVRRDNLALTPRQHLTTLGVGVAQFGVQYPLVYFAETKIASAVVAVVFAALAFINLGVFAIVFRQRANLGSWFAAFLGVAGVAALSWEEIAHARLEAGIGVGATLLAVLFASFGNVFAKLGERAETPLFPQTAFAMGYGALSLAIYAALSGIPFRFDPHPAYVGSLLYLAVVGSVLAFGLYYALARRRGYAVASYISAMTPPLAMLVSSVLEKKSWGLWALAGVALVIAGQIILLRSARKQP